MDASSIPTYNVFTCIAKTLRILELCLAPLLLSWFLTHLPLSVNISTNSLPSSAALSSSSPSPTPSSPPSLLNPAPATTTAPPTPLLLGRAWQRQVVEYHQRKLIMNRPESDTYTGMDYCTETLSDSNLRKVYRRSQSEKSKENGKEGRKTRRRKLWRSETEKVGYPQDKLSNEEFQRTIEAFIAKQMRLLREESVAIFVPEPTNQKLQI